jgi:long-chain acyl-CoA synthetase
MSFGYLPWEQAQIFPDAPCVRDDKVELTYAELDARIAAFAGRLADHGFGRGDVLAVMLPNRVELLVAILAAWRLDGAATPVNPVFTAHEADYQIADSGAALVLNEGPHAPAGGCPALAVEDMTTVPVGEPPAPVELAAEDLALLIYTSGSTGRPKGVMLDHGNAEAMTAAMVAHFGLTERDHCLPPTTWAPRGRGWPRSSVTWRPTTRRRGSYGRRSASST